MTKSDTPKKKSDSSSEKERKARRDELIEDASEVAGIAVDELSGLGVARRLYVRLKQRVGREYIEEIKKLSAAHEELILTNNFLVRAGNDYIKRLDELELEVAALRSENRELKRDC